MEEEHEQARYAWPTGFEEFLIGEFTDFSPLMDRALQDNWASLLHDGPDAESGFWRTCRAVFKEFVWPV
ncbi:Inositol 2-dehydrogenase [Rhodococcus sp. AW25M09]|uniref:hypothetical protein n=1 Tax=Rhodococcus sp. AW25M09 TaxID=1268303 RepID=UPI0002AC878F|nr:hypothetical protein [Rhodococcus sp. AW25M09]CCQ15156.1 Inositol 2-dehydrogenase [Rhodococcus sp. AW25M09]